MSDVAGSLSGVARLGSNPPRIHVTVSRAWNAPSDVRVGYCARRSRASSRRIGRRATGGPRCALGIRRGRGRRPRGGGQFAVVRSREALRRARSDRSRSLPCTPQLTVARGHRRSDSVEPRFSRSRGPAAAVPAKPGGEQPPPRVDRGPTPRPRAERGRAGGDALAGRAGP